jgi:hypothetical protein
MNSDIGIKIFHVEVKYASKDAVLVEVRAGNWELAKIALAEKYPDASEFFLIDVRVVH